MIVEMTGLIVPKLSDRDDPRAREIWNRSLSFLAESRKKFDNRQPIEQIVKNNLRRTKTEYDLFETRASIFGKPAPALKSKVVVHGDTSTSSGVTLRDFHGKVVLLEFWNVHCRPCIAGFPHLTKLEEKYGERGLIILGVTSFRSLKWNESTDSITQDDTATVEDESKAMVNFAKQKTATHRLLLVEQDKIEKLYKAFGVEGNPVAFLIDRRGNVRKSALGSDQIQSKQFEDMIEKLLDK